MFLMSRLVSRSSRSLAVMTGAASSGRGRCRDDLRGRPSARPRSAVPSLPQSSVP